MAKNRRQFIDGVKLAVSQLPAGATDRDFLPQIKLLLGMYDKPAAVRKSKGSVAAVNDPHRVAAGQTQ